MRTVAESFMHGKIREHLKAHNLAAPKEYVLYGHSSGSKVVMDIASSLHKTGGLLAACANHDFLVKPTVPDIPFMWCAGCGDPDPKRTQVGYEKFREMVPAVQSRLYFMMNDTNHLAVYTANNINAKTAAAFLLAQYDREKQKELDDLLFAENTRLALAGQGGKFFIYQQEKHEIESIDEASLPAEVLSFCPVAGTQSEEDYVRCFLDIGDSYAEANDDAATEAVKSDAYA
jgi:hypothetical protein